MTIDKAIDRLEDLHFEQDNWEYGELMEDCLLNREALRLAIDTMRKYQKLQADYENRLKVDLVAMLTEIQLEIEELDNPLDYDFEGYNQCAVDCEKLIQQKIDKLKEAKDGENNY